MADARFAQKGPVATDVEGGKICFWCCYRHSGNQPFADGGYEGTTFAPYPYMAEKSCTVRFCGCEHSGKAAPCDGTQSSL